MEKRPPISSNHGHILCQAFTPPEVFFGDFPGIDKGTIGALIDAAKTTNISPILDKFFSKIGIKKIKFSEFIKIYGSAPYEVVDFLLEEMKEAGIERMIILMLDMAPACGQDYQEVPWQQQIEFFGRLSRKSNGRLIPYYGFDPRRKNAFEWLRYAVEHFGFRGVKLYTKLGYSPNYNSIKNTEEVNGELRKLYDYCERKHLPMANHTSGGGVRGKFSDEVADELARPQEMFDPLMDHPGLHFCFAHFCGNSSFMDAMGMDEEKRGKTDVGFILKMMREHDGTYAGISFHDSFVTDRWRNAMRTLFEDPWASSRTLIGEDWPLIKPFYGLKKFHSDIRENLGDDIYFSMACYNFAEYVFEGDQYGQ